ncbi:MAG: toxin-antitoxin system YwqK family antitoxin, partial [Thermogutta sp.]
FLAWTGAAGRCMEFGTPAFPQDLGSPYGALPRSPDPGSIQGQEQDWLRILSTPIVFKSFMLPIKDQQVLVRPQIVAPTISVVALAAKVETTLLFIQAGLQGRPMVATQPLVFVFSDENVDKVGAPILVASFFRGYLHGPVWLLHPDNGTPMFFGEYEKGMRSGRFLVYDCKGLGGVQFFGEYKNNRKDGVFMVLKDGRPVYVTVYRADMLLGECLVEWVADEPQVIPTAALASDNLEALRQYQRTFNWAEDFLQGVEPPIKQVVVQVFRMIDFEIKRVLARSYSVAARQRILQRYEQLAAAQKAFHATLLESATAGMGGSPYGAIAAEARSQLASSSRNMNEAFRLLSERFAFLLVQFRQVIVVFIQEAMERVPENL